MATATEEEGSGPSVAEAAEAASSASGEPVGGALVGAGGFASGAPEVLLGGSDGEVASLLPLQPIVAEPDNERETASAAVFSAAA